MTITIDLPPDVADTLAHRAAQEGRDIAAYVRQLAVHASGGDAGSVADPPARMPGLHAGWYQIADDFDAPLPDEFWLGTEVL